MSAAQLQELMAQVKQLTLVNSKLQQELSSNSTQIARLESAMHQRRGRTRDADAGQSWSRSSSARSSRSGESQHQSAEQSQSQQQQPVTSHGHVRKDSSSSTSALMVSHESSTSHTDRGGYNNPSSSSPVVLIGRQRSNDSASEQWAGGPDVNNRERRDSGSCDHTESEFEGRVCRDVSTNTPSAHEVHFAQLPGADDVVGPGVISSDRHGNERVTIATQTTEIVMATDSEPQANTENVRGCSKATAPQQLADFYHGAWPIVDGDVGARNASADGLETRSVVSFHSSISSHSSRPSYHHRAESNHKSSNQGPPLPPHLPEPIALTPPSGNQPFGSKVQMVYSLLSMLGTHDPEDMSQTLLAMSSSPDSCTAMRQSGCLPLLVQLIYGSETEKEVAGRVCRARACQALHNIIHSPSDDQRNRREIKILKYLEVVQAHCEHIREDEDEDASVREVAAGIWPPADLERNPGPAVAALMKLSFDDYSRQPICALGGLQCMAQLIKFDQQSYSASSDIQRITMRRYACMTLTNLTFGDSINKARLCAMQGCLNAIVLQLQAFNEDLCQVAASVIRNLSWRADQSSKQHLRVSQAASKLMITAIQVSKESTLKSILSALWNLSAHCTHNKTCICEVDGSIEFLVKMLIYQSPTKTLAIVECAGGILRNISSVIAMRDDYRQILRDHDALLTLLTHLKSPSLAIVGNACGALWNISARCPEDQQVLIDQGAVAMLKNLTTSKHRLINLGSSATIKNLMQYKTDNAGGRRSSGRNSGHSSRRGTGDSIQQEIRSDATPQSPSKNISPAEGAAALSGSAGGGPGSDYRPGSTSKVHRTDSQDSVGSCSSLTSREGVTTLNKIEHIMQQVIQTNMEIHQLKKVGGSTHSSDTRLNSGSSTPRSKPTQSLSAHQHLMSKSSEYPAAACAAGLSGSQGQLSGQRPRGHTALSPRVNHKQRQNYNTSDNTQSAPGAQGQLYYPALVSSLGTDDRYSATEDNRTNFSMTYNDDNIDNCSEKPVDYSQRYQETNSVYGGSDINQSPPRVQSHPPQNLAENMSGDYSAGTHIHSGFLPAPHDPVMLLQNSQGSFLDPSYFDIPSLDQIKARAVMPDEPPHTPQHRQQIADMTPDMTPGRQPQQQGGGSVSRAAAAAAMTADFSRLEEHHGEDQVRTFCTEGTPMYFLSTATSMNELHRIGEESIPEKDEQSVTSSQATSKSHTTQDSVKSNPAFTQNHTDGTDQTGAENKAGGAGRQPPRLPPPAEEDELPRTYATEDTPLTGISRVSSLSSLTSAVDGRSIFSGADHSGVREPALGGALSLPSQGGLERIQENEVLSPANLSTKPATAGSKPPTAEHKSVSFDEHAHVQETPMMFSRASSLASLSSCDQQSIHSSVFSDYSRRASQVVSPSDLPDSPGDTSPVSKRKLNKPQNQQHAADGSVKEQRTESLTPPLPHPDDVNAAAQQQPPAHQTELSHQQPADQQAAAMYQQYITQPASISNTDAVVSNLLGLSGQFGSLSGLASLQGPEISENGANNGYSQQVTGQSVSDYPQHFQQPQLHNQPQQHQYQHQQFYTQQQHQQQQQQHQQQQQQYMQQYMQQYQQQHNNIIPPYMQHNVMPVSPMVHQPHPVGFQHHTTPHNIHTYQHTQQGVPHRMMTPQSAIVRPMNSAHYNSDVSTPVRPGILRPSAQAPANQQVPQTVPAVKAEPTARPLDSETGSNKLTGSQEGLTRSQDAIVKSTAAANRKVDQFLTDTVRTYAVEGTPGPNSSRSSLSALTFLDEPDCGTSPALHLLRTSMTKSRESILSAKSHSKQGVKKEPSPGKPLDLSMKTSVKSEPAEQIEVDAPPLPPKPAHLGGATSVKRRSNSSSSSLNSPSASQSTNSHSASQSQSGGEKSPALLTTGSMKSPAADSTKGGTAASDKSPASVTSSTSSAVHKNKTRSRQASETRNDSDSSSDGDDSMLQQCITSAMPMSRTNLPKSASDSLVSSSTASGSKSSGSTGRHIPRSKTFGAKLRLTSKKTVKAAQLAKQRQAPPIVSANSPTPDDDYFAEETVMAYCTEDTPYNKSTATSLSDLSVIDDDGQLFETKSESDEEHYKEEIIADGDRAGGIQSAPPSQSAVAIGSQAEAADGAPSISGSSSDSSDNEGDSSMLSNAIFSALPKKATPSKALAVKVAVKPVVDVRPQPDVTSAARGESVGSGSSLRYTTGNEIRASDIKYQTSADSVRNYATEGTPNNFSTNTSLSDLTIESHYSTNRPPLALSGVAGLAQQRAANRVIPGGGAVRPPTSSAALSGTQSTQFSPSRHSSLLPRRHPDRQLGTPSAASQRPQAASSPYQHKPTPGKPGSTSGRPGGVSQESDEIRTFGVEGTPFNYSRRESLSSLSCDSEDEGEVNITIINRVTEGMRRADGAGKTTFSSSSAAGSQSTKSAGQASSSTAALRGELKAVDKTDEELMPPPPQPAQITVRDGVIKRFTIPQSDGYQSRDEMTKTYTPIEGTPYCFSRNSPLSSLSSGSDSDDDPPAAPSTAQNKDVMSSIAQAHQAEGGRSSISSDSDSDDDNSQGSLASSHAFLSQCISSALPKKTSTLPRPSAKSASSNSASNKSADGADGSISEVGASSSQSTQQQPKTAPPKVLPKPKKPQPVNLLPSSGGEMVVSQRTPSRGMSTETSTDSLKSENTSITYKQTQVEKKQAMDSRELRRKTYTITESEIKTAISLIPTNHTTTPNHKMDLQCHTQNYCTSSVSPRHSSGSTESNIVISGDEDDFDDVFMLENGELFKHDVSAILAALRDASELEKSTELLDLPEPPMCFSDSYTDQSETSEPANDQSYPSQKLSVKEPIESEGLSSVAIEPNHLLTEASTVLEDEYQKVAVIKKGPRITKPNISKSESVVEFEQTEAKVVKGRRKPLYPGKKIICRQPVTKPSAAVIINNKKNKSNPFGNGKTSSNIAILNRKTKLNTNLSTSNKPTKKSTVPTSLRAGNQTDSNDSKSANGVTTNISQSLTVKSSTVPAISKLPTKTNVIPSTPKSHSTKPQPVNDKQTVGRSPAGRPQPVGRAGVVRQPPTVKVVGRKSGVTLPGVKLTADAGCGVAVEETDDGIIGGRTVSSRAVLHRAADQSKAVGNMVRKKSESTSNKPTTTNTVVNRRRTDDNSSKQAPKPSVTKTPTRPQAVSKIACLWKKENGTINGPESVGKMSTRKSPSKTPVRSQTSKISSTNPTVPSHGKRSTTDYEAVPDFVSAISFREHPTKTSPPRTSNNDSSRQDSAMKAEKLDNNDKSDELTPKPGAKKDINSARVRPFLYKPSQRVPVTNGDVAISREDSESTGGYVDAPSTTSENATSSITSTHYFNSDTAQESRITVHLDIKPSITVSDVSPSTLSVQSTAKPSGLCAVINNVPDDKSLNRCGELGSTDGEVVAPAMTKTEMLLRRRSEILKRRESESSSNSVESTSPSSRAIPSQQKSTLV